MGFIFDAENGDISEVGGFPPEALKKHLEPPNKQGDITDGKLSLNVLTRNPGVVIFSHSSPGCYTVIVNGKYYQV
jgi:hypothetical protein